jgi:hypothetical protein
MVESAGDTAYIHVATQPRDEGGATPARLGSDALEQTVVIKTSPRTAIRPGDLVDLTLVSSRVHLFDDQTEERLTV